MLTNFQNPFTTRFDSKFITNSSLKIQLNLKRVATLPCEIFGSLMTHCSGQWYRFLCDPIKRNVHSTRDNADSSITKRYILRMYAVTSMTAAEITDVPVFVTDMFHSVQDAIKAHNYEKHCNWCCGKTGLPQPQEPLSQIIKQKNNTRDWSLHQLIVSQNHGPLN